MTYYGPALDPPLGGFGPKVNTNVRGHEYFIPTKFGKYPLKFGKYPLNNSVVKVLDPTGCQSRTSLCN